MIPCLLALGCAAADPASDGGGSMDAVVVVDAATAEAGAPADAGDGSVSAPDVPLPPLSRLFLSGQVSDRFGPALAEIGVRASCGVASAEAITDATGGYALDLETVDCEAVLVRFEGVGRVPAIRVVPSPPPHHELVLSVGLERAQPIECEATCRLTESVTPMPVGPLGGGQGSYLSRSDAERYVGRYQDDQGRLLGLVGLAWLDPRDPEGRLARGPERVCFRVDRRDLDELVDVDPDSGSVELLLFALDESSGDWLASGRARVERRRGPDGALEPIGRNELGAVRAGDIDGADSIWVCLPFLEGGFRLWGFALSEISCVEFALANACGGPARGASVELVGRTFGFGAQAFADRSGRACLEVPASEQAGEDLDLDGIAGEAFLIKASVRRGTTTVLGELDPQPRARCGAGPGCLQVEARIGTRSDCRH